MFVDLWEQSRHTSVSVEAQLFSPGADLDIQPLVSPCYLGKLFNIKSSVCPLRVQIWGQNTTLSVERDDKWLKRNSDEEDDSARNYYFTFMVSTPETRRSFFFFVLYTFQILSRCLISKTMHENQLETQACHYSFFYFVGYMLVRGRETAHEKKRYFVRAGALRQKPRRTSLWLASDDLCVMWVCVRANLTAVTTKQFGHISSSASVQRDGCCGLITSPEIIANCCKL